jgi:radical SAM superfamily enzyme YgiQ (UPF0313 family)
LKVLLIVPTVRYTQYPVTLSASDFPTGFAYLASSLTQAGHEVYGLNLNNLNGYSTGYAMIKDQIVNALESKPDLIGLGGLCIDYKFLKDAINIIREKSHIPIVLGGGIVNNDAEFIFNHLHPDFCIKGEGEETLVKLCNLFDKSGSLAELGNIDNLCWWNEGQPVFNKENFTYPDINSRPFPDFDSFGITKMLDEHSYDTRILYRYSRAYPRPMIIVTARGCPFKCLPKGTLILMSDLRQIQ